MQISQVLGRAIERGHLTLSNSGDDHPITAYFEGNCGEFVELCRLTSLKTLVLDSSDVSDDCFPHICNLKRLNELSLQFTSVSGRSLDVLPQFPELESLCCNPSTYVSEGCHNIARCGRLRRLDLDVCALRDEDLAALANMEALKDLSISQSPLLTDACLNDIGWISMVRLERFAATDTHLGDAAADRLAQMKSLQILHLSNTLITDASLRSMALLPNLRALSICSTNISDAGIEYVSQSPTLRNLAISGCPISDDSVASLVRMTRLESLQLAQTRITRAGIARLKAANRALHISDI